MDIDYAIVNAKVLVMDEHFSKKNAIAVRGGRIVLTGSSEDVRRTCGKAVPIFDAKGKTIIPGVNDGHIHTVELAGTSPEVVLDLTFPNVKSLEEIRELVKKRASEVASGVWIRGQGYDPAMLLGVKERTDGMPRREDLDDVSLFNPVVLTEFSGHASWVNSAALVAAGLDSSTKDPEGGEIVRDPITGIPTGLLKEPSAMGLVGKIVPLHTEEELYQFAVAGLRRMAREGITSFTEPALGKGGNFYNGGLLGERVIEVYKRLYGEGRLTARVSVLVLFEDSSQMTRVSLKEGIRSFNWDTGAENQWFRYAGVKLFADGIPIIGTSYMNEEYEMEYPNPRGSLTVVGDREIDREEELKELVAIVHEAGLQVGVHATGDRAIQIVLDGIEEGMRRAPQHSCLRHTVHHSDFISRADLNRAAELGVLVNMQPLIQSTIADAEVSNVGPDRAAYEWPYRTTLDAGVTLAFSSDAPVVSPSWRKGLQSAVTRASIGTGVVIGEAQRVTREEALKAYTVAGAIQDKMESEKGMLMPGMYADFVVLDQDILSVPDSDLAAVDILMTVVAGKVVFAQQDYLADFPESFVSEFCDFS